MRTDLFDFELPAERIALRPASPRDSARMLVVQPDGVLRDRVVADLPDWLEPGLTMRRLEPSDESCCSIDCCAPRPTPIMAITAATPINIPRMERNARILCAIMANTACRA